MKKPPIRAVVTLALLTLPADAHAEFITGNALLGMCENAPQGAVGFVAGVVDTMVIAQEKKMVGQMFCLRPRVNVGQLTDVACAYVKSAASIRDLSAATLVGAAMSQSFPCK